MTPHPPESVTAFGRVFFICEGATMSDALPAPSAQSPHKSSHHQIRKVNEEHKESLNRGERLALAITQRVGTMGFFLTIFTWTVLWLGWNILAPDELKFDPPRAFVFWLF